jgi:F420-non-reducing hydrogenase iron-sulfur subunit
MIQETEEVTTEEEVIEEEVTEEVKEVIEEPEVIEETSTEPDKVNEAPPSEADQTVFEPKIVGFLCNWCSYAGADLAGVSRFQYPPNLRIIRLMCSGRVDPNFIIESLIQGADGVFIGGCHPGDCHYLTGNLYTEKKIKMTNKILERSGLEPGRLRLEWIAASEGELFAKTIAEFTEQIKALGPNPISGPQPDKKILSNVKTAKNSVTAFRLRALVAKERKLVEEGNVYGELKDQDEWNEILIDAINAEYSRNMILLLTPTDRVLEHIVHLRKRNMLALSGIDGTTPKYLSLIEGVD